MMTINGTNFVYTLDSTGLVSSFYSKLTKHEYVSLRSPIWRMIISTPERPERPVFAAEQSCRLLPDESAVIYDFLLSEGERLDIRLRINFYERRGGLSVTAELTNNSPYTVSEFMLAPVSGVRSLAGDPTADSLVWPNGEGHRVPNPSNSDLSVYAGFRKYERHDYLHTDLDRLYPGSASMQWYSLTNDNESIYCASEDTTGQTVCLHIERTVATNSLSLGFVRYPFLEPGESVVLPPLAFIPLDNDWHAGARLYREWLDESGYWKAPVIPDWMRRFEGWLRVILKPHHLEINWPYSKIPELFDEAQAYGLDTIFLLGWEKGGFARMWPDYIPDESGQKNSLGDVSELKAGIDYVHSRGGHVAMFLSYYLIDTESEFWRGGGERAAVKNLWGKPIPFAETYCGEGTWRKLGAPPMPMYAACSGSDMWQEKMLESAKTCLDLGADAVLYDIGGMTPYFCFAEGHDHTKPSMACASKAGRYNELRKFVKSYGADRAIYMEHNVDIFGQSMDLAHSGCSRPRSQVHFPELYRYTFPELNMTNRELGQDDTNYLDNVNYTYVMGFSFDMTIFRCCGSLRDVPKYAAYMKKLLAIRQKYEKYFHFGRFVDTDGFTLSGDTAGIVAKSYAADDGTLGVALWNSAKVEREFTVDFGNAEKSIKLAADEAGFVHN